MGDDGHDPKWMALQNWLKSSHLVDTPSFKATLASSTNKGRILVALEDIPEATPILSIPASALLNITTLPLQFHSQSRNLTATQALTLYIAQYRLFQRARQSTDADYPFGPYLDTLPDEFPDIPLVWVVKAIFMNVEKLNASHELALNQIKDQYQTRVLAALGPIGPFGLMSNSTAKKSDEVSLRFIKDWEALLGHLSRADKGMVTLSELLWAWLVVNTRCLWYGLGQKQHGDNIALAPAIDMANHDHHSMLTPLTTPHALTIYSSHPSAAVASPMTHRTLSSSKPPEPGSSPKICIRKGDEVTFAYGPHGNATLLVEYGFVVDGSNPWDAIDLTEPIEQLFDALDDRNAKKKALLERAGYWGEYSVHCSPLELSHRVLVALRLLHMPLERMGEWQDHVDGKTDDVGQQIEALVRLSLRAIFLALQGSTKDVVERIKGFDACEIGMSGYALDCLATIARNELATINAWLEQSED